MGYSFNFTQDVFYLKFEQSVDDHSIFSAAGEILSHREYAASARIIIELDTTVRFDVSSDGIFEMARRKRNQPEIADGNRYAFISDRKDIIGTIRMLQALIAQLPVGIDVFSNNIDAMRWLKESG